MAGKTSKGTSLEAFLRANGGHLHANIAIAEDTTCGFHWRATDGEVRPGDTIISVPHSMALSYLNALVDEDWPILQQCRQDFKPDLEVEAISFFYLIAQYLNRERSFWKDYLDALPAPEEEHTQPLFFDDQADVDWLAGTDVWHTNETRIAHYREIYEDGKTVLRNAGHDGSWCTWHLFKWAAATFTSRSFSSRALRPRDSKYWAAYRHGADERSQTVLIDMSHASAFDFPVLFPGLDIGNHTSEAKIDYLFDPGRFQIKTNTATAAGDEVFNNYGPKGNDELLLGYGFCIPGNPHSSVSLTLKTPPEALQQDLRNVHPGYFRRVDGTGNADPVWNAESATVQLLRPGAIFDPKDIFQHLPEPLLELLIYVLRFERGHPFAFIEHPRECLSSDNEGKRYLPHIANIMLQSLMAKLQKVSANGLGQPSNEKQRQAAIYRSDQREVIVAVLKPLQSYLKSLVASTPETISQRPCLAPLETFLNFCQKSHRLPRGFLAGIEANTNTADIEQLRLAGWEEDIWVLLLVALDIADAGTSSTTPSYIHDDDKARQELAQDPEHPSRSLLQLVRTAAEACPDSIWISPLWTLERICEHARRLEFDGFTLPVTSGDGGTEEIRFCIYLHDDFVERR